MVVVGVIEGGGIGGAELEIGRGRGRGMVEEEIGRDRGRGVVEGEGQDTKKTNKPIILHPLLHLIC